MFDLSLEAIVYTKAITLLATVAVVMIWLSYYCYRLKQKNEVIFGTHHAPYIAYSVCIIAWISSNAYFHTNLLPELGASAGIFMAKFANLASFLLSPLLTIFLASLRQSNAKAKCICGSKVSLSP